MKKNRNDKKNKLEGTMSSPQTPIWNQAYQKLKEEEEKKVVKFEKIMGASSDLSQTENTWLLMRDVVKSKLESTASWEKKIEKVEAGGNIVKEILGLIKEPLSAVPEARAPVAVLGLLVIIVVNAASEQKLNRKGIDDVRKTLDWYWELVSSPLQRDHQTPRLKTLFESLLAVDLFKALLSYQMDTIIML